jgi:hypothetical protein
MPTSKNTGGPLAIPANENTKISAQAAYVQNGQPSSPTLTPSQQSKQDAIDLAELIYDIFKDSLSSAKIVGNNGDNDLND